jgi:hypothetical protein
MLGLLFYPDNGSSIFLRIVGNLLEEYMQSRPRIYHSSYSPSLLLLPKSGSFNALLMYVSRSSFCDSSFGLNVFSKCSAKVFALYHFVPRPGPHFRLAGCLVSVVLIVWLLPRVNSRCQLSLLSFGGVSAMFSLLTFLFSLLIF